MLQNFLQIGRQYVIKRLLVFVQLSQAIETAQQGVYFEDETQTLLFKVEQLTYGRSNLGQENLNSTDIPFDPQVIVANKLLLGVEAPLF